MRGTLGVLGQLPDLFGHHGKPATLVTGPGGLDRRIEGQQVGLLGDPGDRLHDRADLIRLAGQFEDRVGHRLAGAADRVHRQGRLLRGVNTLHSDSASLPRDLGTLSGALGRRGHLAGNVLGGVPGRLDHLHLPLGTVSHVTDSIGDLA